MYLINSIDRTRVDVPLFVTLTYPGQEWERFGGRKEDIKRHLDVFNHWLRYRHPQCSAIWRLEYQKRGAPHFHLLVFGVGHIDCFGLAYEWYKIVGSKQQTHLEAGTEVRFCGSWPHAAAYVSKYMAKTEDFSGAAVAVQSRPGRIWGIWGKRFLPREPVVYGLSERKYIILRRTMRRWAKSRGFRLRAGSSFSAFLASDAGRRALVFAGAQELVLLDSLGEEDPGPEKAQ